MFMSVATATHRTSLAGIFRRKPPLGVTLTEDSFTSFHAAHAAGSKTLEELVESIRKEEKSMA
jgi:hypothetical protein